MTHASASIATRFTRLLGCTAPIQLAAMPGISTPALVAAVAEAGGLGMLGTPMLRPAEIERALGEVAAKTSGAFGAGFLMPFLDLEGVDVAARSSKLVEFFYGEPSAELVERVHRGGALASWQVGSVDEARRAEAAGCDLIVAQGTEAGGHVRGRSRLLDLLAEVVGAVSTPVVAAGGLATRADLAAVLDRGADGARLGTRFVAAAESGAHPTYVDALLGASAADTCLTEAFAALWPDAPHRVLRSALAAAEALPDGPVGEIRLSDRAIPVPRLSVFAPTTATTGHVEAMALYAGESVTHVRRVQPAAEIVAELISGIAEGRRKGAGRPR